MSSSFWASYKTIVHFWLIRSCTQDKGNVNYIFIGLISKTSEIIEMINCGNGTFSGRMIQVNIDPFTRKETEGTLNGT